MSAIAIAACVDTSAQLPLSQSTEISGAEFAGNHVPDPASKLRLCRNSSVPSGTRLGGITYVLGRDDLFGLGEDESCSVQIVSDPSDFTLPIRTRIADCQLAVGPTARVVSQVQFAVENPTEVQLQKCFFRVGLWAIGQVDYLLMPDSELFIPLDQTRFWGLAGMPQAIPNIPLPDDRKQ